MKNIKYISASAGSGKTFTLTETLAEAIRSKKVEPENVILTTYTRAAAAEFKEKAKAKLYEQGLVFEADRLDQALIGTIHSVAENLIQKYWYVLGLSPKINPIEEGDLDFFRNQSLVALLTENEISFFNDFALKYNIKKSKSSKINFDFWKDDLSKILEYTKNYQIKDYKPSLDYSQKKVKQYIRGNDEAQTRKDFNSYIELIFSLAKRWNEEYQNYKTEHHLIDFADMEDYFYKLLDNSEVRADIKATYKYVFVDEFQDCSPIQLKIFEKLSDIVEHSIWVGDKKQAIFGFRGSDTTLTTAVMDVVKENEANGVGGCTTDILSNSWRSLPSIVDFTNKVFTRAFNKVSPEEKKEVCLSPKREGNAKVGYWWLDGTNVESRCSVLASNIVELINKGENPSDIAVLAGTWGELKAVATALRGYDVPVYIDEDVISATYTVSLVTSLLQLIEDGRVELPKAQLAFLTEDGYKLGKIIDDKFEYNQKETKEKGFYDDVPLVKKILEERGRLKALPLSALVKSLVIELDLYRLAKKLPDSDDSERILHALIDYAEAYEKHCELLKLTPSILEFIAEISKKEFTVPGSTDGVQLFTCHKSKGLEWKTVILLGLEKDILNKDKLIKNNIFGTHIVYDKNPSKENLFPLVKIGVFPDIFGNCKITEEWANAIEKLGEYSDTVESEKEEYKRLMYVAMTRPRDNLILALNGKGKGKEKVPKPLVTFKEFGFCVAEDFSANPCDLFGVGFKLAKFDNAPQDIEFLHEKEKNRAPKIAGVEDKNALLRDLQPSSMPGGKISAEFYDCAKPIATSGKYNSAALGTFIHNVFCVADYKSNEEIAEMVRLCGFGDNLQHCGEIKKSWNDFKAYLEKTYGKEKKLYHELPFKQRLANGQIVTGSIDFVWETEKDGVVVVDFKTFNGAKKDLLCEGGQFYAGKYKGQLECYERILTASGKKVIAKLLFYPMLGFVCKV